ncbi:uncharacterized protein IUM83_13749 [Phytophthora cinnamomi]|uniref:uncharacterized protein n=1 Tax=Phytophthora cinnamomi TaxID=4785 RepID=UPI003559848B|nr:hypothetical protein IUM83_13749 [Phytophthora cinnamomi]
MTCSVMKALDMLRQLQSSPELSPLQHSSVHTLSVALELFAWMENELAAIDAELTSVAAFLASAEAGYLSAEVLESKLQVVATVERAMPNAESALGDLWEVGPFLWSSVSTISS